jgi:hypothetical protein
VELYPLIHERVADLLSQSGITGWRGYAAQVFDRSEKTVAGYRGLAVSGRCESIRIDKEHSQLVYRTFPGGEFPNFRGLQFTDESWDGSDFFMSADGKTDWIVVTDKVERIFRKAHVKNCVLTPISEVEIMAGGQSEMSEIGDSEIGDSSRISVRSGTGRCEKMLEKMLSEIGDSSRTSAQRQIGQPKGTGTVITFDLSRCCF